MTTLNLTASDDIIIPTNDSTTYRGLGGNDTYILVSQKNSASVSIIDTEAEFFCETKIYVSLPSNPL